MDIVFVHGWGFGPNIWDGLSGRLPGTHYFHDLGFIENDVARTDFLPESPIVIGHSLGVMWALKNLKPAALVSIAGFDCFHHYVPQALTRSMLHNLDTNPMQQMRDFWNACGVGEQCEEEDLNIPALKEGLEWLLNWDESGAQQGIERKTLALAAKDDMIVRKAMSDKIWGTKAVWSDDGGHMLPITKTNWCAENIEGFLQTL